MSADVIIPADVAKDIAAHFRKVNAGPNSRNEKWADLLDPQPPSLREQVAHTMADSDVLYDIDIRTADAVLAVVADWLAAQPLAVGSNSEGFRRKQRDHDVRLLRGAS